MKRLILIILLLYVWQLHSQNLPTVYLIPGTGADGRLFQRLDLGKYDTIWLEYIAPKKSESFDSYIDRLSDKIDTTVSFSLIGVSLGGIIATELADRLEPEKVIVIAGAKARKELPVHYRFFHYFPIHRLIGGRSMRWSTKRLQPLFEPMNEEAEMLFEDMISAKSDQFLKSAVRWMIAWERETYASDIIHVHGDKDRTLPLKNVTADYVVEDGGHMIVYTHAEQLSVLLRELLGDTSNEELD